MSANVDSSAETKHTRQTFSPEEFVGLLRKIVMKEKIKTLLVLNSIWGKSSTFNLLLLICLSFALIGCTTKSAEVTDNDKNRIVTIGGSVTETAFALGADDLIVGTDTSSIYPEKATKLPQVGYQRQLSAEGVLSLKPTLVLATSLAGIPTALEQIKNAGVKIETIPNQNSVEGTKSQIEQIAKLLNREEKGKELIKILENDLSDAEQCVDSRQTKPKVLFIYARGAALINVGGVKTAGDEMIKLAGGENVITEFEQYKPLTAETIVSVQPEYILLPRRSLESIGGKESLMKLPGILETPAGRNGKIISMDDLMLLGFTPRLGKAVKELCGKLR